MAGPDASEGQAVWQPGGAEEDSHLHEGNRCLHLAYDEERKKELPANCLQHIRTSGQGTIMCTSLSTHWALIMCNKSCATCYERTAQLLYLTEFKSHLLQLYFWGWNTYWWRRGGNWSTRRKPLMMSLRIRKQAESWHWIMCNVPSFIFCCDPKRYWQLSVSCGSKLYTYPSIISVFS